jgi:RNA polymerase sigma-70 factor (ECF subfamily)
MSFLSFSTEPEATWSRLRLFRFFATVKLTGVLTLRWNPAQIMLAGLLTGVQHNDRCMDPQTQPMSRSHADAALALRVSQGDSSAFHELTDRYYRPVCAFLYKRLQQADTVEDLAQETFLEAFRALKEGRVPAQFSSWLFGIAVNRCGKWFRRKRPGLFPSNAPPEIADEGSASLAEEVEDWQHRLARLEGGLAELPDEIRTLLTMKHQQGKTCEQIAVALGQPVGTIKSQLSRTYKRLRSRLGGEL